jgi:predicted deacetylase
LKPANRRLIVSFHDLHPGSRDHCQRFIERCRALGADALSLLIVPRFHGRPPFTSDPEFVAWLGELAAAGHDLCLHGNLHRADRIAGGLKAQVTGRIYTAGEGEFHHLTEAEAERAVADGLALFRSARLPVYGFTAPAWLISDAARRVLVRSGFLYQTLWDRVELLQSGESLPAPTLVYSSRSAWRRLVSRLWVPFFLRWNRNRPLLRLAVHPVDLDHPAVEAQLYAVLEAALEVRTAVTYRDLVPEAARKPLALATG